MSRLIDITGQKFGRLTAISRKQFPKNISEMRWLCLCDCGNEKYVASGSLRNGDTQSCGCLLRESPKERFTKHGLSGTPEYNSWRAMMHRCFSPNDQAYKSYGGRGIKVCKRWHSIENFLDDMGPRPEGTSLERKNNDLGYNRKNCVWIENHKQSSNKQNTVLITAFGKTQTQSQWAREMNLDNTTLSQRIKAGVSIEISLTVPPRKYRSMEKLKLLSYKESS